MCNACGLVYAKMVRPSNDPTSIQISYPCRVLQIKKRYKEKANNPKKNSGNSGAAKLGAAGAMTSVLSSGAGGMLHVIAPNDSEDDGSDDDDEYASPGRRSD